MWEAKDSELTASTSPDCTAESTGTLTSETRAQGRFSSYCQTPDYFSVGPDYFSAHIREKFGCGGLFDAGVVRPADCWYAQNNR